MRTDNAHDQSDYGDQRDEFDTDDVDLIRETGGTASWMRRSEWRPVPDARQELFGARLIHQIVSNMTKADRARPGVPGGQSYASPVCSQPARQLDLTDI